jgi:photosystem II stability/assembly factor-like uncharacterized protein
MKSSDGGANFVQQQSSVTEDLFSVFFIDAGTGFAAGDNGTLLRTVTGGS